MKNKVLIKKISNIVINVLLYLFLAVAILSVIMAIIAKKDVDGAAELFGYQMRIVTSDSMAKCELTDVSEYDVKSIPVRSMIFVQLIPEEKKAADAWYANLKVGDVLTFRYVYTNQVTVTHRITAIEAKETGGYIISLAGDNKNSETEQLYQTIDTSVEESTNYVIGKVTGQNYPIGFVMSLVRTTGGIIFIVMVPCFIIILLEIIKIVSVLTAARRKRDMEEQAKKDNEIEELRRQLAELQQQTEIGEEQKEEQE